MHLKPQNCALKDPGVCLLGILSARLCHGRCCTEQIEPCIKLRLPHCLQCFMQSLLAIVSGLLSAALETMVIGLLELQVLPLQVASLLLVTLPWTLPRLLDLQAANPVAVLDGKHTLYLSDCPHCHLQYVSAT